MIDCYSKMVVGWSMAAHMKTSLIANALDMAAGNITLEIDCIFHSDRGSQYTEFRSKLRTMDMRASVGRTGIYWDNAAAESFFGALKNELIYRTTFLTREHARKAIAHYIEVFYNRKRLHSALGYKTPVEALPRASKVAARRVSLSRIHCPKTSQQLTSHYCSAADGAILGRPRGWPPPRSRSGKRWPE